MRVGMRHGTARQLSPRAAIFEYRHVYTSAVEHAVGDADCRTDMEPWRAMDLRPRAVLSGSIFGNSFGARRRANAERRDRIGA